jgi:pimeloyl-ACP methyl ester carboxylesterase
MSETRRPAETTALTLRLKDGRTVGYAEYGDPAGTPVLALHGAPACRLMFAVAHEAAKRLNLRLIAPDRPGYGLTPPDHNPTLQDRADWLAQFVDDLGLDRFGVLGISGGGPYSVALAAKLGNRILGLALVSPMGPAADYAASAEGHAFPIPFLQRLTLPLGSIGGRLFCMSPQTFSGIAPRLASASDAAILARPEVRRHMVPMTVEAFRQDAHGGARDLQIFSQPWNIDYARVTAKTIMWQGTADTVVPPMAAYWLAAKLPHCTLNRIDGAGHFWVFDHVDEVMQQVRDLLPGGSATV